MIKVRAQPYIEDFGIETSHTGKSATITDGQRLELLCNVPDEFAPVNITWLRSDTADSDHTMVPLTRYEIDSKNLAAHMTTTSALNQHQHQLNNQLQYQPNVNSPGLPNDVYGEKTYTAPGNIIVERISNSKKRLIIEQVGPDDRGYYACVADNGVTERTKKTIFIRVKDNIIALWPLLGILAELFILFTIIHVWETQKAYKEAQQITKLGEPVNSTPNKTSTTPTSSSTSRRTPSGPSNAYESAPLNG